MAFVASAAARSGFTRSWHTHSLTSITRQKPTLISPCQIQRLSHHFHTQKPRPTPVTPQRKLPPTRRLKSTTTRKRLLTPRTIPLLLALAVAGVAWDSQWLFPASAPSSDSSEATILANGRKFVPFTVTSKDPVSPTSFILTLKPPHTGPAPLSSLWDVFDLWCVEVKQPQIQVAREYTPLPGAAGDDALRLYVRALRGGEVSTYLSRLLPGDLVEIRGPHGEFDLRSRLGEAGGRVVFLAGGTGVASALQAAHAVLPRGVDVTIFWAVRGREEVQGAAPAKQKGSKASSSWGWNPFSGGKRAGGIQAEALSAEVGDASAVSRELLALKERYGDKLDVRVVVDQEGTRVGELDLSAALAQAGSKKREGPPPVSTEGCKFHSQTAHLGMVDGAPNAGKRFLSKDEDCACVPKEGAAIGKNVFVISGPEGFVQAYAGPKIWRDGGQLQGPVGGLLGAMQKGNPDLLKEWIVLKL
ncbi:Cytochrome c mitochondrial import factor CYC2 [Colletotrichum fructicola]|uniref:Cytochrome c mitochondrial import factor CYC2 n=1 Tax=Colletotrichum fructicola (strain Nara gc5) TaxID=1213859 RepID=A0A7J6JK63_COLFN|nr:Cytochrome c mitochondrial import factor CYC2 [Colletotrichum fructicola]KAF4490063.1 Cytochrome c mitochondrial import factor CYC2 [Colletotrichum fructicola Nara gc5]KAF4905911.1 Cytochrome c mitochondrial import factor CYC2 [Colletotrichum fructicola]KAF4917006.1 Cytochrome c mitochondrial import factor CYC2 [Colletotrichum fructicola]KAF4942141.1 Cytochrome c mitochondrial import factor CYC2 [Colletotrichum fructicola]